MNLPKQIADTEQLIIGEKEKLIRLNTVAPLLGDPSNLMSTTQ